jgi:hypothetical protein
MNPGLTIAFIAKRKNDETIINYEKFGNQYWTDGTANKSKIGGIFIYYHQLKYVRVHKIDDILESSELPPIMSEVSKDKICNGTRILCLSNMLKEFTWNEWITEVGKGAPYTPKYRQTQTNCWTFNVLNKKYNTFNFMNFIKIIENQDIYSCPIVLTIDDKNEHDNEDNIETKYTLKTKRIQKITKRMKERQQKITALINEQYNDSQKIKKLL